jgi:hypothetical protein
MDKPQIPQKERVYDWHIMDAVVQSGKFSARRHDKSITAECISRQ